MCERNANKFLDFSRFHASSIPLVCIEARMPANTKFTQQNIKFHRNGAILHQFMKKCAVNESNSFRCRGNFSGSRFGRAQRGRRGKEDEKRSRGEKKIISRLLELAQFKPSTAIAALPPFYRRGRRTPSGEKRDENLSEI